MDLWSKFNNLFYTNEVNDVRFSILIYELLPCHLHVFITSI